MDRDATINFLEDQFHDLQLVLDEAQGQLHGIQHAQDALHAPPDEMQVDGEDEPQEIQGVSRWTLRTRRRSPHRLRFTLPWRVRHRSICRLRRCFLSFCRLLLV